MAQTTKPEAPNADSSQSPKTERQRQEMPETELNKVTGGGGDPCEGGEVRRR